jgi:diacylglycerol kinase (ATP)
MRYQVILNPAAGSGNGGRVRPQIQSLLARQGLDFGLVQSDYAGEAVKLAADAVHAGVDVIVAAGGDGTVNEILNGMLAARTPGVPLPALGIFSAGRGNDFAGSLGLPADIDAACQVLAANQRRCIDIGIVRGGKYPEGRYFINCVGIGFDAITTLQVVKLPRWGGFFSFIVAILQTAFLYNRAPLAIIRADGQVIEQRSLLISVMNGRRLGGGFIMAPDFQPDDGLFDVCIAQQMSPWRVLGMIPHFMRGDQYKQPGVRLVRTSKITIRAQDGPLPAHMDGEIINTDGQTLEMELLPRQIEILCTSPGVH